MGKVAPKAFGALKAAPTLAKVPKVSPLAMQAAKQQARLLPGQLSAQVGASIPGTSARAIHQVAGQLPAAGDDLVRAGGRWAGAGAEPATKGLLSRAGGRVWQGTKAVAPSAAQGAVIGGGLQAGGDLLSGRDVDWGGVAQGAGIGAAGGAAFGGLGKGLGAAGAKMPRLGAIGAKLAPTGRTAATVATGVAAAPSLVGAAGEAGDYIGQRFGEGHGAGLDKHIQQQTGMSMKEIASTVKPYIEAGKMPQQMLGWLDETANSVLGWMGIDGSQMPGWQKIMMFLGLLTGGGAMMTGSGGMGALAGLMTLGPLAHQLISQHGQGAAAPARNPQQPTPESPADQAVLQQSFGVAPPMQPGAGASLPGSRPDPSLYRSFGMNMPAQPGAGASLPAPGTSMSDPSYFGAGT